MTRAKKGYPNQVGIKVREFVIQEGTSGDVEIGGLIEYIQSYPVFNHVSRGVRADQGNRGITDSGGGLQQAVSSSGSGGGYDSESQYSSPEL